MQTFLTPHISSFINYLKESLYTFSMNVYFSKCPETAINVGNKNFLILKSILT